MITLGCILGLQNANACAFDPYYGREYYNLFSQELIDAPQYYPFLNGNSYVDYYHSPAVENLKNENLESWADYLNISYDQAKALVFDAPKTEVDALVKGSSVKNSSLSFINSEFVKKHKQALLYISYAKYLEPYMRFYDSGNSWSYNNEKLKSISDLDYKKVEQVLIKSWNAESDKELKLRYGYQLVRFAHYNGNFELAVNYFNKYVESLQYKPVMYYYALDQKAGALHGLGKIVEANYDFFKVFSNTRNIKESALTSMSYTADIDFNKMLSQTKTENELLDAYLLIGYQSFSNPLEIIKKILAKNPNAIQAKVLMAKAVNSIEYQYLPQYYTRYYAQEEANPKKEKLRIPFDYNKRYSNWNTIDYKRDDFYTDVNTNPNVAFMKDALDLVKNQLAKADKKEYWQLTLAYLQTLNQDYSSAKNTLAQIKTNQEDFSFQKKTIETLVYVLEQDKIDSKFEQALFTKYGDILSYQKPKKANQEDDYYDYYIEDNLTEEQAKVNLKNMIWDVLANRYYLQGELAKAFLIHNDVYSLGYNPDWAIIEDLEKFDQKKNKTSVENLILKNVESSQWNSQVKNSLTDFVHNFKGTIYLRNQKFDLAKKEFSALNPKFKLASSTQTFYDYYNGLESERTNQYDGNNNISSAIFGYNTNECYSCDESSIMKTVYLKEFEFIKSKMNKLELTNALIELEKFAKSKDEKSAIANLLLGNFYYNTSDYGFFRELLTFDYNNANGPKFRQGEFYNLYDEGDEKPFFPIYYKDYEWQVYDELNNNKIAETYLNKAKSLAKDKELKALTLFASAKVEQVNFYHIDISKVLNLKKDTYWLDDDQNEDLLAYKRSNYRQNFKELKAFKGTQAYNDFSNCLFFDYYTNNY